MPAGSLLLLLVRLSRSEVPEVPPLDVPKFKFIRVGSFLGHSYLVGTKDSTWLTPKQHCLECQLAPTGLFHREPD